MKNELAKDIVRGDEKLRYDTQCKKVLANKTILAWILKHTAEEFRGMEIFAIKACMEGEAEISSVRIEPGYDIVTRGIFYAARLISAQSGTEFTHSHYDDIKKVYSIWLCMNAPKESEMQFQSFR